MREDRAQTGDVGRLVLAALLPLAVLGVVYAIWWISDRLVIIGPIDRATFGWLVVVPLLRWFPW